MKMSGNDGEKRTGIWKLPARFADFPIGKYQGLPTQEHFVFQNF